MKVQLTDNERKVLEAICSGSNWNSDKVAVGEPLEAQHWECEGYYACIADTKDYGCGLGAQATRAIFASLKKKHLIGMGKDEVNGEPFTWIFVDGKKNLQNVNDTLGTEPEKEAPKAKDSGWVDGPFKKDWKLTLSGRDANVLLEMLGYHDKSASDHLEAYLIMLAVNAREAKR